VREFRESGYEELDSAVDDFCNDLALAQLESPAELVRKVSATTAVYAHRFDYAPYGAHGLGRFRATFSHKHSANEMRDPDEIWMLTISVAAEYVN